MADLTGFDFFASVDPSSYLPSGVSVTAKKVLEADNSMMHLWGSDNSILSFDLSGYRESSQDFRLTGAETIISVPAFRPQRSILNICLGLTNWYVFSTGNSTDLTTLTHDGVLVGTSNESTHNQVAGADSVVFKTNTPDDTFTFRMSQDNFDAFDPMFRPVLRDWTLESSPETAITLADYGFGATAGDYGLAYDGTNYYMVTPDGTGVVSISATGTTLGTIALNSANTAPRGLAYAPRGTLLVQDDSGIIYFYGTPPDVAPPTPVKRTDIPPQLVGFPRSFYQNLALLHPTAAGFDVLSSDSPGIIADTDDVVPNNVVASTANTTSIFFETPDNQAQVGDFVVIADGEPSVLPGTYYTITEIKTIGDFASQELICTLTST